MNNNYNEIKIEKNPILREIWSAGYDCIIQENISQELTLVRKSDGYKKTISLRDLYTIIKGENILTGEIHEWLCHKDGSVDKFRELIKITP